MLGTSRRVFQRERGLRKRTRFGVSFLYFLLMIGIVLCSIVNQLPDCQIRQPGVWDGKGALQSTRWKKRLGVA